MVSEPEAGRQDFGWLRLATSAGEGPPEEPQRRSDRVFGVPLLDGLGTTESAHLPLQPARPDSPWDTGRGGARFEVKVADEEGREVPDGTVGHLWVRGGSRALGYWRRLDKSLILLPGESVVTATWSVATPTATSGTAAGPTSCSRSRASGSRRWRSKAVSCHARRWWRAAVVGVTGGDVGTDEAADAYVIHAGATGVAVPAKIARECALIASAWVPPTTAPLHHRRVLQETAFDLGRREPLALDLERLHGPAAAACSTRPHRA